MNEADEFNEQMWQHMQWVNQQCAKKLTELRRENTSLRKTIAQFPATAWELQEKVAMLEMRILQLRVAARTLVTSPTAQMNQRVEPCNVFEGSK